VPLVVAFEAVELLVSVALPMGEQHIHGVEHDQHRFWRELSQNGLQALHFVCKAE